MSLFLSKQYAQKKTEESHDGASTGGILVAEELAGRPAVPPACVAPRPRRRRHDADGVAVHPAAAAAPAPLVVPLVARLAAGAAADVDALDQLPSLAPDLAGELVRVERAGHRDRMVPIVVGDGPDPLLICTYMQFAKDLADLFVTRAAPKINLEDQRGDLCR
ncbi:uncharacterized protein LOC119352566 [Triticum dicoccoides]|uniref:uncharacterized protein LOC119352566 n=1 Tax=Triticum dicoccoides TaxID=85692 RepID=UPI00188F8D2E|nr:uncharacterized protein LOC119352566 [Triticum dicoccoides]